jgi:hypothetical protein
MFSTRLVRPLAAGETFYLTTVEARHLRSRAKVLTDPIRAEYGKTLMFDAEPH